MNPAAKQPADAGPPTLPVVAVIGLALISAGTFFWIWALMWGNWIKKKDPTSRIVNYAQANIIPGALFYMNLPTLLLALRENATSELMRLRISFVLWGTIASVSLIATYIAIFRANRRVREPEKSHGAT